jgi:Sugar phosphate isomerases/epimerases
MRYAVCNEMFGSLEFARQADMTAAHGFHGIEIAPFTLFGDFSPGAVKAGIVEARKGFAASGLDFAGLHWLFVKPDGLHVTARDEALRRRSWEHLALLVDICGELGGGNMIFGSPRQRASRGIPKSEALEYFTAGLVAAGRHAAEKNSLVLLEPLPSADTDIMNTLTEARAILDQLHAPGLSSMFDFHNTADETEPWDKLVEDNYGMIRHVHINTMNGGWPTGEDTAMMPVFSMLQRRGYQGWASLEIFTIPNDPARVLMETRDFLDKATAL